MKRGPLVVLTILVAIALIAAALCGASPMRGATSTIASEPVSQPVVTAEPVTEPVPVVAERIIRYYNSDLRNSTNFGPDRRVMSGKNTVSGVLDWTANNDGTGDFFESIAEDPALCAAIAVHMDEKLSLPRKILRDEQNVPIEERADAAHLHFLRDYAYWDEVISQIKDYLTKGTIEIKKLKADKKTTTAEMLPNGLGGNKPSVVFGADFEKSGAWLLKFTLNYGTVRFLIEYGYQPTDVDYIQDEEPEPVVTPTPAPVVTEVPATEEPAVYHATYTKSGSISFSVNGEWFVIDTFWYAGGYIPEDDPRYSGLEFENEFSYGTTLVGNSEAETISNWFHELPKSPLQVVRLAIQTGLIEKSPLKSETDYAYELIQLPAEKYDEYVNWVLGYVYNQLNGGIVEFSTDWSLENMMKETKKDHTILFGRRHGDDDKAPNKDVLFTMFNANRENFISAWLGLENTAKDAGVKAKDYGTRAWINATEGGTWKWKKGASNTPTPPPSTNPPPTDPPTPTPTPTATSTPTATPSPTPTATATPTATPSPTPTATATPTATPTPPPTPSPTPTLEPKPSDAGPQGQTDDDEEGTDDFGGGQNHDNDQTLTDEPESPDEYVAPAPPTAKPTEKPTQKPTEKPTEKPTAKPTAKPTEKPTEKPTAKPTAKPTTEVVVGQEQTPLEQVQEEQHDDSTVDDAVAGDGVNEGDLDPDEVE